jgi:hypothetical protein
VHAVRPNNTTATRDFKADKRNPLILKGLTLAAYSGPAQT